MNTTDLFVELIVIGAGAAIWVVLLVLSVFGYTWLPFDAVSSLLTLIPVLSIVYVLGIMIDRIADALFDRLWTPALSKRYYKKGGTDYDDRRFIYVHSERLADLLEYGRSRLRICRGWALNTVLILLTMNLFVWTQLTDPSLKMSLSVFGSVFLALLAFGFWYSWRQLTMTDYRKVHDQAAFLRSHETLPEAVPHKEA